MCTNIKIIIHKMLPLITIAEFGEQCLKHLSMPMYTYKKKDEMHIFKNSTQGFVSLKFNQMRRNQMEQKIYVFISSRKIFLHKKVYNFLENFSKDKENLDFLMKLDIFWYNFILSIDLVILKDDVYIPSIDLLYFIMPFLH